MSPDCVKPLEGEVTWLTATLEAQGQQKQGSASWLCLQGGQCSQGTAGRGQHSLRSPDLLLDEAQDAQFFLHDDVVKTFFTGTLFNLFSVKGMV